MTVALANTWLVFWAQDFAGALFSDASANRGAHNRYWISPEAQTGDRFEWNGGTSSIDEFNATPAEEGAIYLSDVDKNAILAGAGITTSP